MIIEETCRNTDLLAHFLGKEKTSILLREMKQSVSFPLSYELRMRNMKRKDQINQLIMIMGELDMDVCRILEFRIMH